ncbi:MAG: hypothetical protein WC391_02465 [Methanoregula sp.]|jgi:hypothetical protein
MKYTTRHIKKYIEQGKIDPQLWKAHFPHILESQVPTCEDCEDLKNKICEGGKHPIDCLLAVQAEVNAKSGSDAKDKSKKEKSRKFYADGRGRKDVIPSGANKTFDQSKM